MEIKFKDNLVHHYPLCHLLHPMWSSHNQNFLPEKRTSPNVQDMHSYSCSPKLSKGLYLVPGTKRGNSQSLNLQGQGQWSESSQVPWGSRDLLANLWTKNQVQCSMWQRDWQKVSGWSSCESRKQRKERLANGEDGGVMQKNDWLSSPPEWDLCRYHSWEFWMGGGVGLS